MSCYKPMIAVDTGAVNKESGKKQYKFLKALKNWNTDAEMRKFGEPQWYGFSEGLLGQPQFLVDKQTGEVKNRAIVLPCGQCLGCRTAYAASWADRIMLESLDHDQSYFITLTYDPANVPISHTQDGDRVFTLRPSDLQDFIKRVRRQQEYNRENRIRFYAVGEYGTQFHRPHYHIIIFGLILDDLYEIGRNKTGRMLHSSKVIEKEWPFGRVEVDKMTWETAAYCARYTVKKLGKTESDFYKINGLVPEFSRMSRRPGIGMGYFEEHYKQIYSEDKIHIPTSDGSRTVKPPRYYDKKYDDINPVGMAELKGNRQNIAKEHIRVKMKNFTGSYFELLANEEKAFKNRTKSLRRTLE